MVKLGTILRLYKKKKAISNHSLSHTHPAKKILHCTKILKKTSSLQTIFTYATQNSPSNNISYYKSTVPKSILHEKGPTKLKVYLLSVFLSSSVLSLVDIQFCCAILDTVIDIKSEVG